MAALVEGCIFQDQPKRGEINQSLDLGSREKPHTLSSLPPQKTEKANKKSTYGCLHCLYLLVVVATVVTHIVYPEFCSVRKAETYWAFFSSSALRGLNYQYPMTLFFQSSPLPSSKITFLM